MIKWFYVLIVVAVCALTGGCGEKAAETAAAAPVAAPVAVPDVQQAAMEVLPPIKPTKPGKKETPPLP